MSDLITDHYRTENKVLHEKPGYGSSGHLWLGHVAELMDRASCNSLLDYGCGKATLGPWIKRLGWKYAAYDPATHPKLPVGKHDMVVALDVLEHIEPRLVQEVLGHIAAHTGKLFFANVCTRPSSKTLSDGRNAHLIVQGYSWWKDQLTRHFKPVRSRQNSEGFEFVGTPQQGGIPRTLVKELRT